MALTTQVRASITASQVGDLDLTDPTAAHALSVLESLADGTSNVQADKIFSDTRSIALSSSEELDFGTTGGLSDAFGVAFEPAEIVAVLIVADEGNTNNVVVGAAAAEPFLGPLGGTAPTETIKPGGFLFWFAPAGWAKVNNTNDKLKIANSGAGTAVAYSIVVIGRSA